ncbi:uncharacterized protein BDR25DRAFT_63824 [Lindgomyces ingoldianus]|uniref:Uncharacterized protein n=1 Tax=Lindgomyces ingoldianus TaxID=673940 RepID=A0ACB6QN79_9PLEO|nr:uncharacterized protein BDR25DRAFT_63824 [Lindgomyces ingoldianus]KAF2467570.1 hypothetical protein BDR25DRAFT_63824 [Lindgomyces ingoldianus]
MADDANASAAVNAAKAVEGPTRSADAPAVSVVAELKPAEGGDAVKAGEAGEDSETTPTKHNSTRDETTTANLDTDATMAGDETAAGLTAEVANGAPASSKKLNNKRKSGASVPEHKKKTPSKKKKGTPELRLNVSPGDYWFVAMRGFAPWPVIVCDEEMLPETLLSKRPVSAQRIDGTYREDFLPDGKNAKDRRYPIMFLGTNEFAWQVNTDLQPLNIDDIKTTVDGGNQGKKSKALWEAYQIAAKGHELQWFKDMLENHEKAMQADIEEKAAAEAKKQEKKDKAKRKSIAADDSEDVEMENADDEGATSAKKTKASKKRKKEPESDGENEKPTKTPKTKLKLNNKAPKEESAMKPKKDSKVKKAKAKSDSEETEAAKVEEKPMTEAERLEKREKSVLYLRHRLQKGFLSRDQAPKEEEMANMSEYLKQLEAYKDDLEAEVIKKTKVHKVLKAIIKLDSIPKEEEYEFKKRSNDLLGSWTGQLAVDADATNGPHAEPATNGVQHDDDAEKAGAAAVSTEKPEEMPAELETAKAADADGDVPMADVRDETPVVKADASSSAEGALVATAEATTA